MKSIKESSYTDRINALKGKRDARNQRNTDRQSTEIIQLRQELEDTKNDFLVKHNKFLFEEVPYVNEAFEILNSLADAELDNDVPSWFYCTTEDCFGIVNSYTPYCGLFAPDCAFGIDISNVNDPHFIFGDNVVDLRLLSKVDFTKDIPKCYPFGEEYHYVDGKIKWWEHVGTLKQFIKGYSAVLDSMSEYTEERKKWFEKVDNWLTEMEKEADSDLDGDGKIGEQKKAKQVVNKILEGADIRQVLCNESKRWVFDIYLDDLPDGNLVGESDENEDFETREEAEQEAKGFLVYLCEEYNRKESDFRVEYYQIDV